jgi:hypothetical protein
MVLQKCGFGTWLTNSAKLTLILKNSENFCMDKSLWVRKPEGKRSSTEYLLAFRESSKGKDSIYTAAQKYLSQNPNYKRPSLSLLEMQIDKFCAIIHCSLNGQLKELAQIPIEATDEEFELTGTFTLTKFLGRGQAGTVFLAEDDAGKPLFAIKIIHLPGAVGVGLPIRRTFLAYQKVLKLMDHPYIVSYLGWTVVEDEAQVYTDYCEQGSLTRKIYKDPNRPGIKDIKEIKQIISEILFGLVYIHSHGIIHRYNLFNK